jgi:hypothetical protein
VQDDTSLRSRSAPPLHQRGCQGTRISPSSSSLELAVEAVEAVVLSASLLPGSSAPEPAQERERAQERPPLPAREAGQPPPRVPGEVPLLPLWPAGNIRTRKEKVRGLQPGAGDRTISSSSLYPPLGYGVCLGLDISPKNTTHSFRGTRCLRGNACHPA